MSVLYSKDKKSRGDEIHIHTSENKLLLGNSLLLCYYE